MSVKGCYGKIPAHGDFVWQGLPGEFVTPWDHWLQTLMAGIQNKAPDRWLDAYLKSPLWRFVIRDASLGPFVWCGVMMPSIDAVGRYFPFTMAEGLPLDSHLPSVVNSLPAWFDEVEDLLLQALRQCLRAQSLLQAFDRLPIPYLITHTEAPATFENRQINGEYNASNAQGWTDAIMEGLLTQVYPNPALWFSLCQNEQRTRFVICDGFSHFHQVLAVG